MARGSNWAHFGSALAGVAVGALLIGFLVPAGAATGDPVIAGKPNQANASTIIKGTSGAIPLRLESALTVAPLQVTSSKRVPKLNADLIDGRHADSLVRVAYCADGDAPDYLDYECAIPFVAPRDGYLVMSGSVDTWMTTGGDLLHCEFTLDGAEVVGSIRDFDLNASNYNQESNCATDAGVAVSAGAHTAVFHLDSVGLTTRLLDVGAYVIFTPFGPEG
jgi:hypothetical protein